MGFELLDIVRVLLLSFLKIVSVRVVTTIICILSLSQIYAERKLDCFIESDKNTLDLLEKQYGASSQFYLKPLIDRSLEYNDTTYIDCYAYYAKKLSDAYPNVRTHYGIDSEEFRLTCVALNGYLLGKYFEESDYKSYSTSVIDCLRSLEKEKPSLPMNKVEFFTILSGLYRFYINPVNYEKALSYEKKRYKELIRNFPNDAERISSTISELCFFYGSSGKHKELSELLSEMASFPPNNREICLINISNGVKETTPGNILDIITRELARASITLGKLPIFPIMLAKGGKLESMILFEQLIVEKAPIEDKYKYFSSCAVFLRQDANNLDAAKLYQEKALDLAEKNNRLDLLWNNGIDEYKRASLIYDQLAEFDSSVKCHIKSLDLIEHFDGIGDAYREQARYISSIYGNRGDIVNESKYLNLSVRGLNKDNYTFDQLLSLICDKRKSGNLQEAKSLIELGINSFKVYSESAQLFNQGALIAEDEGDYNFALTCYDNAIKYEDNVDRRISYIINKAGLLRLLNLDDEAVSLLKGVLSDNRNLSSSLYYRILTSLGLTCDDKEKGLNYYDKAEAFLTDETPTNQVRYYLNRAFLHDSNSGMGRENLDKALELYENNQMCDSTMLGEIYLRLADYHSYNMMFVKADDYYLKSLECLLKSNLNNETVLTALNNAAINRSVIGDYKSAIRMTKIAVDTREQSLPIGHLVLLTSIANLVGYLIDDGQLEEAEKWLNKYELYADESSHSINNILFTANRLAARIDEKRGDFDRCEANLVGAYKQARDSQQKAVITEALANFYRKHSVSKGVPFVCEDIELTRQRTISELPFLSASDRVNWLYYLSNTNDWLMDYLEVSPQLIQTAAEFALFKKGLLFHTQREIEKNLWKNKQTRNEYGKLRQLKSEYNISAFEGDSVKYNHIKSQIDRLERELAGASFNVKKFGANLDLHSDNVLKRLGRNDLAIDFVHYTKSDTVKYGAFLFSKEWESPKYVPLFSCKVDEENLTIAGNVYKTIWEELIPYMENKQSIFFCPDGIINQLPIEFSLDTDNRPLNQVYSLHRVFHLAETSIQNGLGDNILAIGISDHNSPIGKGDKLDRGSWTDLNGVKEEIGKIETLLANKKPTILFNDDATEENVKRNLNDNISSLHISTHGVYRDLAYLNTSANDVEDSDYNIARRILSVGKTSLSGLILRKGNLSWKSSEPSEGDDDILTSEEIEMLSMPNLRLTVLSACDSGLGHIDSEGVWGLQRAFRIAGSKNLICSLQKIDDYWTSQFMAVFYTHAAQGNTIYDSFHHAQKTLYEADPDSPEIWSSFILIE